MIHVLGSHYYYHQNDQNDDDEEEEDDASEGLRRMTRVDFPSHEGTGW